MPLIDEKGVATAMKWINNGKKFDARKIKINSEIPIEILVKNEDELGILKFLLMRSKINYDITKVSEN